MKEELRNKTVLLDTNIIIEFARNPLCFKGFFDELVDKEVIPAVDDSVKCEFLRKSNTLAKLNEKKEFLNSLLGTDERRTELPVSNEIFLEATGLSNLFNFLNDKNNSAMADCLLAAQLKKYKGNLYLATMNNRDFPLKIFDRVDIYNIEIKDEIRNVGIYKFSEAKYGDISGRFMA